MPSPPQETKISVAINGTYGIDRAMPSLLMGQITEVQWTQFCDQVDDAVVSLNRHPKLLCLGSIVVFLGFVASFAYSFIATNSLFDNNFDESGSDDYGAYPSGILAVFLIPGLLMLGMMGLGFYIAKKRQRAMGDVKNVCQDISNRYRSLSFHLRDDKLFIPRGEGGTMHSDIYVLVTVNTSQQDPEIEDGSNTTYTGLVPFYPSTSVTEYASTKRENGDESLGGRLDQLELIRTKISQKEYDEKRQAIIAEI
mmetsp:Transcript_28783/g.77975  ORF Transcript_28783/g.77975 Transcript_28783/m.77975 type:complete len:253 (+) Transcript_28783:269-1027(+)